MYTIADYGAMISDKARMEAMGRALRHAVTPGAVVVEVGTGTGIFALLACRLGARRVYAIEAGDVIQVAREVAVANGCADRIEFIQAVSTTVALPEPADVLISDLGGNLPWFQQHIESITDARRRFLKPGGTLIPRRDVAWAAVVQMPEWHAQRIEPWTDNVFGFDMSAATRLVVNSWSHGRVTRDNLLTEPERWATLDYSVVEEADVRGRMTSTVMRPGTGHGIAAGFERTLADGICISNAPDAPDAIRHRVYGTVFLSWPAPVALEAGDRVTVDLEGRAIHGDYIWCWKTRVSDDGPSGGDKATFSQSTFFGKPLSPATLHTMASRRAD